MEPKETDTRMDHQLSHNLDTDNGCKLGIFGWVFAPQGQVLCPAGYFTGPSSVFDTKEDTGNKMNSCTACIKLFVDNIVLKWIKDQ